MDIELLVSKMTAEEKSVFEVGSANEYYEYVINELGIGEIFKNKKDINTEMFDFILGKLYLVVGKAVLEDGNYTLCDELVLRFLKRVIKLKKLPNNIYSECYKYLYFLEAIKMGIAINEDLLDGHEIVSHSRNVRDLKILYSQHDEADLFRANQEYFEQLYENLPDGVVDSNMRSAIYAMENGCEREKQLVKRYGDML